MMVDLAVRSLSYRLFYYTGMPPLLPVTLAVSVTRRCNARCRTCRVYTRKSEELTIGEYEKIFESLSRVPRWITFTGGEPFMRKDLCGIIDAAARYIRPDAITIPTNGWYTERVLKFVGDTVKKNPGIKFIINISLDGIGAAHDANRGLEGCFEHVRETFFELRELNDVPNLHLGINTVISRYNIDGIPDLIKYVGTMEPDTHIFEPAQQRKELRVNTLDLEPPLDKYTKLLPLLSEAGQPGNNNRFTQAIGSFRREYYRLSLKIMKRSEQVIPCFAGIVSAHISPGGNVWPCCTLASPMGNLRDNRYRFDRVWDSREASQIRKYIRARRCYCAMANASYSNIAMNFASMLRIAARFAVG